MRAFLQCFAVCASGFVLNGCGDMPSLETLVSKGTALPLDATVNLPSLQSGEPASLDVVLSASTTQISVDGVAVQPLTREDDGRIVLPASALNGQLITVLFEELSAKADQVKALAETHDDVVFGGRLLLQIDASHAPLLVRQLMFTAGQAQFGKMRFLGQDPESTALFVQPIELPVIGPPLAGGLSEHDQQKMFGPQMMVRLGQGGVSLFAGGHAVEAFGPSGSETEVTLPCEGACTDLDAYPWAAVADVLKAFRAQFPADCSSPVGEPARASTGEGSERLYLAYLPSSCALGIDINGRQDLPWAWWLRLKQGELAAATEPFPYWVLFTGGDDGFGQDAVAERYVPTCQDAACSVVDMVIQRDPAALAVPGFMSF